MQSIANNSYTPKLSPNRSRHILWPYITLVLIILAALLAYSNRNNIYDWYRLLGYKAPANVLALANDDTMTPYALHLYEVNHPDILTSSHFNQYCPNDGGEKTIVLGCYHDTENGIYLLNVGDPRLNGVMEVTAAHEMLHAAYSRLPTSLKYQVDNWLLDYYNHDLKDPRLLSAIAAYKKSEPGDVINEIHSIFGTEVLSLPAPLENYYKRYFSDRQKVADYAAMYEGEFTSRQNEVNSYDTTLSSQLAQINSLKSTLTTELSQLMAQQKQLTSLAASHDVNAYNALVGPYNQSVNAYNTQIDQLKSLIANYNALADTRNKVALTENQLYSELSGTPASVNSR